MLREKFHKNAFAIKFKPLKGNKFDKASFHALMKEVSKEYPRMDIEGITHKRRTECDAVPIFGIGAIALTRLNKEKKNLICVGVNEDYDVSFEREKDMVLGGFYRRVPILDITKDREEIVERLLEYLSAEYPVSHACNQIKREEENTVIFKVVEKRQPKITFHSTFVQIDDEIMSWSQWYKIKHEYGAGDKPRSKRAEVVSSEKKTAIRSVISIIRGE